MNNIKVLRVTAEFVIDSNDEKDIYEVAEAIDNIIHKNFDWSGARNTRVTGVCQGSVVFDNIKGAD